MCAQLEYEDASANAKYQSNHNIIMYLQTFGFYLIKNTSPKDGNNDSIIKLDLRQADTQNYSKRSQTLGHYVMLEQIQCALADFPNLWNDQNVSLAEK